MSSNTTTPDTRRIDDQTATDRAVSAGDRLWAALHARPGNTAEQLANDAGIGRSTAAKILARWVTDGTVERITTDGKKSGASRFAITTPPTPPRPTHRPTTGRAPATHRTPATTRRATSPTRTV